MRNLNWVFAVLCFGYVSGQNNTEHSHNIGDQLRYNANRKLANMTYELLVEAKLMQRQMLHIQGYYQGYVSYEIGYVIGKIRERYKRMIEIYKQAHYMTKHLYLDDQNMTQLNKTYALKPGVRMYFPVNWVINMEYMRLFEVDIDKLVEVLENIPSYALADVKVDMSNIASGPKEPGAGGVIPKGPGHPDPPPGVNPDGPMPHVPPKNMHEHAGGPEGDTSPKKHKHGPNIARTGLAAEYLRSGLPSANDSPTSLPNEPLDVYNYSLSSLLKEPWSFPNDQPSDIPNDPSSVPDEPSSSFNNSESGVPNEQRWSVPNAPPPRFSNEPPMGLSSEPPALNNGKVIRFGSPDNNFRTEEELKRYYRDMYREKHDGMNNKYNDK